MYNKHQVFTILISTCVAFFCVTTALFARTNTEKDTLFVAKNAILCGHENIYTQSAQQQLTYKNGLFINKGAIIHGLEHIQIYQTPSTATNHTFTNASFFIAEGATVVGIEQLWVACTTHHPNEAFQKTHIHTTTKRPRIKTLAKKPLPKTTTPILTEIPHGTMPGSQFKLYNNIACAPVVNPSWKSNVAALKANSTSPRICQNMAFVHSLLAQNSFVTAQNNLFKITKQLTTIIGPHAPPIA